jgi:ELWxxDGT repeat protein
MKKILFVLIILFVFFQKTNSQVTKISNNTFLETGYPINTTTAIFVQYSGYLWVSEGTENSTFQLNIPVTLEADSSLGLFNNKFYFSGVDVNNEAELWETDGTVAGTSIVKNINPGTASSSPKKMVVYNNELYFYATTAEKGAELWKTNGTEAGTVMVKDLNDGVEGSYNPGITYFIYNNELYFTPLLSNGIELWKTNGTAGGTVLVKDINPGNSSSNPKFLQVYNNELFFTADDGSHGRELWKTNGVEGGTNIVKDIFPGAAGSGITGVVLLNNKILFSATAETGNTELFSSDGSTIGTNILKEINAGAAGSDPGITDGIIINGKLIFSATSEATGRELFVTDGTEQGTELFYDLTQGSVGSNPRIWLDRRYGENISNPNPTGVNERLFNGEIFFTVELGGDFLPELWITDGTYGNTRSLGGPFGLDVFGFLPYNYFYTQSGVYLLGNFGLSDFEVYKATSSGFGPYADIFPGPTPSYPIFRLFVLNGKLFFTAEDGDEDNCCGLRDLYVIDNESPLLPLQLVRFGASAILNGVNLNWATNKENNSKEFELQRSTNGANFTAITNIKAAGQRGTKKEYSYFDKDAYQQKSTMLYYQLKIVDNDGKFSYSHIAVIQLGLPAVKGLQVTPNPAGKFIRMNVNANKSQAAQIRIINNNGQAIKSISMHLSVGNNQQVIGLDNMAPGLYYAELITGEKRERTRFVKE